ncbi:hypothetical protein FH972_021056 [Carpinus fangiana]|uniref:isoleucine--tRNA ligase n=1 Tax=Carpinus fangiana TaxID=176857 RepID=A0A5N6KQC5_9ROSI|nr:hypothetical protein FH972_021056 [Carpinus fangiana]
MRPLQFHRPINATTCVLGGCLLVHRSEELQQDDDVLAQWPDGTGHIVLKRYGESETQSILTTGSKCPEQRDTDQTVFRLIHDAGDASAVWALGTDTICKIKERTEHVCSEADIITFVRKHFPSIPLPEVLYTYDDHQDCTVMFLARVHGETLRDAWTKLTQAQQNSTWDQIAEYCTTMAGLTSDTLCGVGGTYAMEPYLYAADKSPFEPLTVLQAQSLFNKYSPPEMEPPKIKDFHFYHPDLGPGNIIVSNGAIKAIIDWESAGFYPQFWIATKPSVSPGLNFHPVIDGVQEYEWRKGLKERLQSVGYQASRVVQQQSIASSASHRHESMLRPTRVLHAAEWSKTLHLPKSTFPPRPLAADRPRLLQQCTDDLYAWQAAHRPASKPFVLHDGPPYANGSLHIGHSLNKILKDIICRFQLSQGKRVHYVPGWDCHGLPIEVKALQALGEGQHGDHRKLSPVDIRKAAAKLAEKTIKEQKKGFREWAVMGDWDNSYKTMDKAFEVRQLRVFKSLVEKGLIYRQHKPVYWSPSSGTALAEAELEYDEQHESLAAYIGFRLTTVPAALQAMFEKCNGALYALIWTTTPWTIPSNSAIAVHKDLDYSIIRPGPDGPYFIVATDRIDDVIRITEMEGVEIVASGIRGSDLAEVTRYVPSLVNAGKTEQPVIHADFVSAGSGTGVVHCAAGHGFDDYNVCIARGIEAIAPVDEVGRFTRASHGGLPESLEGQEVLDGGSEAVLQHLMALNAGHQPLDWQVVGLHKYRHKYPIDWRTKQPVIIRATAQWFADVGVVKDAAMRALQDVKFIPESGRSRLESFISGRSQWCISRQRAWGVPIPALYRVSEDGTEEAVMTPATLEHIIGVIEARGINAWWTDAVDDSAWIPADLPQGVYIRGKDTMDVWFDSGTTWAQLPGAFSGSPPSDVVLEGTDQHRGWFQSSLLTYVANQDSSSATSAVHAPYKTLLTHGFTLDQEGRKMSKSLGNVISPSQIMDGSLLPPLKLKKKQQAQPNGFPAYDAMGADALRLWVASSDYTRDVVIGEPVLKAVTGTLHKLRVTLKWLLGVLSDVSPSTTLPNLSPTSPTLQQHLPEAIALHRLRATTQYIHAAYSTHEPFKVAQFLARYVNHDLSAQWFEAAKDPLYAGTDTERRAAQKVCYEVLQELLAALAPITPLMVQETLSHMPDGLRQLLEQNGHDPFHRVWKPTLDDVSPVLSLSNGGFALSTVAAALETIHAQVRTLQEAARVDKRIGSGLECRVVLSVSPGAPNSRTSSEHTEHNAEALAVHHMLSDVQASGSGLEKVFVVSDVEVRLTSDSLHAAEGQVATGADEKDDAWQYVATVPVSLTDFSSRSAEESGGPIIVRVAVEKARQGKCPRCWQYKVTQPEVKADTLCARCEKVVA